MLRAAAFIELCLPSPAKKPPAGSNWIHEIKHDGYRLMARRNPAGVRLFTSPGQVLPDRWRGRRLRRKWARHIRPAAPRARRKSYAILVAFDLLELDGTEDDGRRPPSESEIPIRRALHQDL